MIPVEAIVVDFTNEVNEVNSGHVTQPSSRSGQCGIISPCHTNEPSLQMAYQAYCPLESNTLNLLIIRFICMFVSV